VRDAKTLGFCAWCDKRLLLGLIGSRTRNAHVIGSSPIAGSTNPKRDAVFVDPYPVGDRRKDLQCY
jgi:hypothetical protein